MSNSKPMGGVIWKRGSRLGLVWLAVFVIMGVLLYGVMGVLGWSGTLRALCALLVAPIVGGIGIVLWWMVRRPVLAADENNDN